MTEIEDSQLVRAYAEQHSDAAFGELVRRHLNLVFSVALRQTRNTHHAEEVSQAVFLVLARKAGSLSRKTILPGWLYQTARLTAANFLRTERRRAHREQEAYMQSLSNSPSSELWPQIEPLLEAAMARLGDSDRNAVVLRFFEGKSLDEVGVALGASEDAARMRVNRALEKLRKYFSKRGVALTVTGLAGTLTAHAAVTAPTGLATALSSSVLKGTGLSASSAALVVGTLKLLTWAKYKSALSLGTALLAAGGTVAAVLYLKSPAGTPIPSTSTTRDEPVTVASQVAPVREPFPPSVHMTLNSPPGAVAVQPDGRIVIGTTLSGWFVDERLGVLGSYRRAAMRFQPDGVLDRSIYCQGDDLDATDPMRAHVQLLPDGRILATGLFNEINEKPRSGCVVLLADGQVDETFEPLRGSTNEFKSTFMPGGVFPAALVNGGAVAVLSPAMEGARAPFPLTTYLLDSTGRRLESAGIDNSELSFSRPSGLILTLGPIGFWARKEVGWDRESPATRRTYYFPNGERPPVTDLVFDQWVEPPTAEQAAFVFRALFTESPLELCRYAVRLPEGGFILAVRTKQIDGSAAGRGQFMRFDENWKPDLSFTNSYEADLGSCMTLKLQKDGKLLIAGLSGRLNGEEFPGLVRLTGDGAIDRTFRCETSERVTTDARLDSLRRRVIGLAIQDDGRIVVSGYFTKVNGVEVPHIARLNPDGSLDETFRTPFTSWEGLKQWRRVPVRSLAQAKSSTNTNALAAPVTREADPAPQSVLITSLRLENGIAIIQFTGTPSQDYILQAGDSLEAVEWRSVSTNRANAAGVGIFRDETAKDRQIRFYRLATP
jgi:RNA polymerase sigma factor (sigma-70 family)